MRRTGKAIGTLAAATSLVMLSSGLAYADNVKAGSDITVTKGQSGTFLVWLEATDGDVVNGCNVSGGHKATIAFTTSNSAVANAPASVEIAACDDPLTTAIEGAVEVSVAVKLGATEGAHTDLTASASGGKTVKVGPPGNKVDTPGTYVADVIRVNVAVSNTAPTVPGAPGLKAGAGTTPNNSGGFTLEWTASTDAQNDAITYTLQGKDSGTSSAYQNVATGLTTNSHALTGVAEGTWTYRVLASDAALSSAYSSASSAVVVDKAAPNAPTATATTTANYNDGTSDWWKDSVTVSFSSNGDPNLADGSTGSGVDASTLSSAQTFSTTGPHTASGTVRDNAGNQSSAGTLAVNVDATDPTASFSNCPTSAVYGSTVTVNWTANDGTGQSGLASQASGQETLDTSAVGTGFSVSSPDPEDNVGNIGTAATCTYAVVYESSKILQPINTDGSSKFKLNSTIPLKIKLTGDSAGVSTAVITQTVAKLTNSIWGDELEGASTATPHSGNTLRYDATSDQYIFNLATKPLGSGTFRVTLNLGGGKTETAEFSIVK